MTPHFLIVGAGFSGCVLAEQLAKKMDCVIDIWDKRPHLGGNCHTTRDEQTGIMVHQYGPHIFNTDKKEIWDYVNSFGELRPYVHRVKAVAEGRMFSFPVNLHTINQYFNKTFSPEAAQSFVESIAVRIKEPKNFEQQALAYIGPELYQAFFHGYTKKQWGCEPAELPASILKRIPLRYNYNDNYHSNDFTGIPVNGYTAIMERMIAHKSISLTLNKPFSACQVPDRYNHVFYTGPIDEYFKYAYGRLSYRTVTFEKHRCTGDFQGASQVNYCDAGTPHTRITEHKHFTPWEQHKETLYFVEYSKETLPGDEPYYPKRLANDIEMLSKYKDEAHKLPNVSFLGRLATYRYLDMQHVIQEALQFAQEFIEQYNARSKLPTFPK